MTDRTRTVAATTSLVVVLAGGTLTGCTEGGADDRPAPTPVTVECETAPAADVTTAEGWIGYLAEHPDTVALALDDGAGGTLGHRADEQHPLASAVKVVHLAAYARAVADGDLDPAEPVPLADWERWYLPGTDGDAHPRALERLGVSDPASPARPGVTVRLDDMVSAMIRESDNAVPDYLRDRLGDEALRQAAARGGWDGFEPPTMLGTTIAMFDPALDDRDAVWEAARRYATDPAYREQILQTPVAGDVFTRMDRIQRFGNTGSAVQLAALHRSVAEGSFGAGADLARAHLEWQQAAPPGFEGLGFKGGSLPGILTDAFAFRRADGTVATAVILTAGMAPEEYAEATASYAHQQLLVAATTDPDVRERIRCAL